MAKRLAIPSKELELKIVGPVDSFLASRIQRVTMNKDIPSNYVDELGNPLHAGQSQGIPNVTVGFSAMDVGIKVFSVLTGNDQTAFPGAGVDISDLSEADAILYVKDATVADYAKSGHGRRLQVRDFTFNYTVDGDSTEDYTLVGSENRWFSRDVVVDRFIAGTTSFTLNDTPIQLKNGRLALSVILDGEYLTEVSSAPATGEYRIVGTTLTTGDSRTAQCIAVYQANPAGTNWSDVSDGTMPAAIQGKDVNVVIAANDIPRIQSVTINGNLNPEEVREMGNRNIAGYQRQVPTVEGTITVLDTDVELLDLLLTGQIGSGDTEFEIGIGCPVSGVDLQIELRDPCDTDSPYTVLKTVYVPEIELVGDSYTSNVNNNASQTFNWRSSDAQCIVYSGAKP
jgi:hypothetical protein